MGGKSIDTHMRRTKYKPVLRTVVFRVIHADTNIIRKYEVDTAVILQVYMCTAVYAYSFVCVG